MCFRKLKSYSSIWNRIFLFATILFISLTPAAQASLPTDPPAASAPASAEGVLDEIQISGSDLKVRGWAGAGDSANPVMGIRLLVDGVEIYSGSFVKQPRPDVAQAKGRSDWLESGFLIQAPINAPLPEGPRKCTATALLKNGDRLDLRVPKESLTVGPAMPATPAANPPQLLGQLDESVLEGDQLKVCGWVVSADPAQQIQTILLKSGEETLYRGEFQIEERPDVAKALGKPDWVNSGWIVRLEWSGKPAPCYITPHFEMETGEILSPVNHIDKVPLLNQNEITPLLKEGNRLIRRLFSLLFVGIFLYSAYKAIMYFMEEVKKINLRNNIFTIKDALNYKNIIIILLLSFIATYIISGNIHWITPESRSFVVRFDGTDQVPVQLFYNIGKGFNAEDCSTAQKTLADKVRFKLPEKSFTELRLDPRNSPGMFTIKEAFVEYRGEIVYKLEIPEFKPANHIDQITNDGGNLEFMSTGNDPQLLWVPKNETFNILNKIATPSKFYYIKISFIILSIFMLILLSVLIIYLANTSSQFAKSILLFLLIILGFIYIINSWSPSSYGAALRWLGYDNVPFYGEDRPIRSDEWAVFTPTIQATVNNDFTRYNSTSVYNEDLRGNLGMPIFDWALLFKPYFWGFLILPPAFAYSFYYYFNFAVFVLGFGLIFKKYGYKIIESIFLGVALYLTASVQFWWNSNAPSFSVFPWVLYSFLICSRKKIGYFILFYSLVSWCMGNFYPPFIYSFFLVGTALVFLSGKFDFNKTTISCCAAVAIAAGGLILLYYRDYLMVMNNTAYPGQRSVPGLDLSFWKIKWQSILIPNINFSEKYELINNLNHHNICSLSIWATIFPMLLLSFGKIRLFDEIKMKIQNRYFCFFMGCVIIATLTFWILAPIPASLARFILLDKIPPERVTVALTLFANLFLICFAANADWKITPARICFSWIGYFLILCYSNQSAHFNLFNVTIILFLALSMYLMLRLKINSRFNISTTCMLFGCAYFFSFNPLQSAKPIFQKHDTQITGQIDDQVRIYGVATMPGPGSVINGLGYPSIHHVNIIPAMEFWKRKFPNADPVKLNAIFNRYGHIQLNNSDRIFNPQADVISIPRDYFSGAPLVPFLNIKTE
jgi:hypothetical protein